MSMQKDKTARAVVSCADTMIMSYQDLVFTLESKKFPVGAVMTRLMQLGCGLGFANKSNKNLLHFAAEEGDCAAIKYLLDMRVYDINGFDTTVMSGVIIYQYSALHYACLGDHLEAVKLLLSYGANINATHGYTDSVIMSSVQSENTEIFDFLVEKGVSVDEYNCLSAAAFKGNLLLMERFLDKGFDLKSMESQSRSILYKACEGNASCAVLKKILELGLDPNMVDNLSKWRPIDLVLYRGDRERLELMLSYGADVQNWNSYGSTGLHTACSFSNLETAQLMLEMKLNPNLPTRDDGIYPLQYAVDEGSVPMLVLLLRYGADPNIRAGVGESLLIDAVIKNNLNIVHVLLKSGIYVNARSESNKAFALHMACASGSVQLIHALVDAGANIDALDAKNMTPLQRVCILNRPEIALALIQRGANVNFKNDAGMTPLGFAEAFENEETKKVLLENGAKSGFCCCF